MSNIAILLGLVILLIGSISYLIAAFRAGILWGLGCLLLPPVSLVFLFVHWQEAKKPFLTQLLGWGLILFFTFAEQGGIRVPTAVPNSIPFLQSSSTPPPSKFVCDGRIYCSQMTSCEEATYFIQNCPNTKMDGNNDGTPCESQWCS